jgi:hypothetical protein
MLQKAFSSRISTSRPIPLWQKINLRADLWKHQQGRGIFFSQDKTTAYRLPLTDY